MKIQFILILLTLKLQFFMFATSFERLLNSILNGAQP